MKFPEQNGGNFNKKCLFFFFFFLFFFFFFNNFIGAINYFKIMSTISTGPKGKGANEAI